MLFLTNPAPQAGHFLQVIDVNILVPVAVEGRVVAGLSPRDAEALRLAHQACPEPVEGSATVTRQSQSKSPARVQE